MLNFRFYGLNITVMGVKSKNTLTLSTRQENLVSAELTKRTTLSQYKERIPIILRAHRGESQAAISRSTGLNSENREVVAQSLDCRI